jgi:hypothetical protein
MNKLLLSAAAIALINIAPAIAQMSEQNYDVLNVENLQNHTGFIALELDNNRSADITNNVTQVGDIANEAEIAPVTTVLAPVTPTAPTAPEVAVPQANLTEPQTATAPINITINENGVTDTMTAPADDTVTWNNMTADPAALNAVQPAAGGETFIIETMDNDIAVIPTEEEAEVVSQTKIIGNTDTGVDPEVVLKALGQ